MGDYERSHPELRHLIAAHCVASFFNRTRFQARLVGILFSRLKSSKAGSDSSKQVFHGNISLRRRLVGQWEYAANSLRILGLGARQAVLPQLTAVSRAVRVAAYLGRPKHAKAGFFQKRYGVRLELGGGQP
jgi:hypothetical protein